MSFVKPCSFPSDISQLCTLSSTWIGRYPLQQRRSVWNSTFFPLFCMGHIRSNRTSISTTITTACTSNVEVTACTICELLFFNCIALCNVYLTSFNPETYPPGQCLQVLFHRFLLLTFLQLAWFEIQALATRRSQVPPIRSFLLYIKSQILISLTFAIIIRVTAYYCLSIPWQLRKIVPNIQNVYM